MIRVVTGELLALVCSDSEHPFFFCLPEGRGARHHREKPRVPFSVTSHWRRGQTHTFRELNISHQKKTGRTSTLRYCHRPIQMAGAQFFTRSGSLETTVEAFSFVEAIHNKDPLPLLVNLHTVSLTKYTFNFIELIVL